MSIPSIFHQVWVPPGKANDPKVKVSMESWVTQNPGWALCMWTDDALTWLQHRDLYDDAPNLVPKDAIGQFRADIARLEILYKFGGMYVDSDTICLRPVDEALAGHDAWAAAEDNTWVGNTYLAATARHPVFRELVQELREHVRLMTRGHRQVLRPNRLSGPRYLTPVWRKYKCFEASTSLWFPYSYVDLKRGTVPQHIRKDAYAVHEWRHHREVLGLQ